MDLALNNIKNLHHVNVISIKNLLPEIEVWTKLSNQKKGTSFNCKFL